MHRHCHLDGLYLKKIGVLETNRLLLYDGETGITTIDLSHCGSEMHHPRSNMTETEVFQKEVALYIKFCKL